MIATLETFLLANLVGASLGAIIFWFVVRPWLNRQ